MRASDKLGPRMAGQICAGYEIIQLHTSLHIPGERIGMREWPRTLNGVSIKQMHIPSHDTDIELFWRCRGRGEFIYR